MKTVFYVFATILTVVSGDLDPSICTTAGHICASCKELATCVLMEGSFSIVHLEYCDDGESCSLPDGCTTNPVLGCFEPLQFICKAKGMYPEPFDCRKYHICVPDNGEIIKYSVDCGAGHGYNPRTFACSNRLSNNACPNDVIVPVCETVGQNGPLSNPSLYYICSEYSQADKSLYPFLYSCPHGEIYDNFLCTAQRKDVIASLLSK